MDRQKLADILFGRLGSDDMGKQLVSIAGLSVISVTVVIVLALLYKIISTRRAKKVEEKINSIFAKVYTTGEVDEKYVLKNLLEGFKDIVYYIAQLYYTNPRLYKEFLNYAPEFGKIYKLFSKRADELGVWYEKLRLPRL